MRTEAMDKLRLLLRNFGEAGKQGVDVPALASALGLENESQRQVLRRRLADLVRRGEVKKLARGLYQYQLGKEPHKHGESYIKMWRAVRVQKGGFCVADVVALCRLDNSYVSRYLRFLEDAGFITRQAKKGNAVLYSGTELLREQHKTPYPPRDIEDAFRAERVACATLHRLMLEDLNVPRIKEKVWGQLEILNRRFSQDEKRGTM